MEASREPTTLNPQALLGEGLGFRVQSKFRLGWGGGGGRTSTLKAFYCPLKGCSSPCVQRLTGGVEMHPLNP